MAGKEKMCFNEPSPLFTPAFSANNNQKKLRGAKWQDVKYAMQD
jgi:hypothetical protein